MSVRRQTANRLTLFRTCGTAYARRKRKLIAEEAQANAG